MAHAAQEYRQLDLAVGQQVKDEMRAQGIHRTPAICTQCHGQRILGGEACPDCAGAGSYEVAV